MENQIKANNIRIQLLEAQNGGLRNSVGKLQAMQQQQPLDDQLEDERRWATRVHVQVSERQLLHF